MAYFKRIAIALFVVVLLGIGLMTYLLGPKNSGDTERRDFSIKSGTSTTEIAQQLSAQGLIRSQFAFFLYAKMTRTVIIPGVYALSPADSAGTMLDEFGTGKFKVVKITIKEGWWAQDIEKELVDELGLAQLKGFTEKAQPYEGYLFPDTYELKVDTTIEEVIQKLRDNFAVRTKGLRIDPDVVIMASIIEREAKGPSDRAAIAGVFQNRLKKGMRLEADATIQYAKGSPRYIVTVDDYRNVSSPYNTYLNDGLPPGAISNPGLASIRAVLEPEAHDYLFYFHAKGETYFSRTYEEHRAKIRQYF